MSQLSSSETLKTVSELLRASLSGQPISQETELITVIQNTNFGLGLEFNGKSTPYIVKAVKENSVGDLGGVLPGDILVSVGDENTSELKWEELSLLIRTLPRPFKAIFKRISRTNLLLQLPSSDEFLELVNTLREIIKRDNEKKLIQDRLESMKDDNMEKLPSYSVEMDIPAINESDTEIEIYSEGFDAQLNVQPDDSSIVQAEEQIAALLNCPKAPLAIMIQDLVRRDSNNSLSLLEMKAEIEYLKKELQEVSTRVGDYEKQSKKFQELSSEHDRLLEYCSRRDADVLELKTILDGSLQKQKALENQIAISIDSDQVCETVVSFLQSTSAPEISRKQLADRLGFSYSQRQKLDIYSELC